MTKPITALSLVLAAAGLVAAASAGMQDGPARAGRATAGRAAAADDVASLDGIVAALYASISGPVGAARDFPRMRTLFAADARLIPTGPRRDGGHGHRFVTVDDYADRSGPALTDMGFREVEIARRVDRFGHIAQVFSTYEAYRGDETQPFMRGINSIQAVHDGERWWLLNVLWQQEDDATPIPEQYLPPR